MIKLRFGKWGKKSPSGAKVNGFKKKFLIEQIQKYFSNGVENAPHGAKLNLVKNKLFIIL